MNLRNISIIFLLAGLCSCTENFKTTVKRDSDIEFVILKESDITPLGWKVSYLTNPDSSVLYIKWTKDSLNNQYTDSNAVAVLRSDYRPTYGGESRTNLYLPYRCANDCEGLMVFSKKSNEVGTFFHVLKFDAKSDRVVTLDHENSSESELKVRIANLNSKKDTLIVFRGKYFDYFNLNKQRYIDSIWFEKDRTFISVSIPLDKENRKGVQIKETRSVDM